MIQVLGSDGSPAGLRGREECRLCRPEGFQLAPFFECALRVRSPARRPPGAGCRVRVVGAWSLALRTSAVMGSQCWVVFASGRGGSMKACRWAVLSLALCCSPAMADEQLGAVVRRLADACVGELLSDRNAMVALARLSRTATTLCTCAAEVALYNTQRPAGGFEEWARYQRFRDNLDACLKAGAQ